MTDPETVSMWIARFVAGEKLGKMLAAYPVCRRRDVRAWGESLGSTSAQAHSEHYEPEME